MNLPNITLGEWIEVFVEWVTVTFAGFFAFLTTTIEGLLNFIVDVLNIGPSILLIILLTLLVTYTSRWQLGTFALLGLLLIDHLGYWDFTFNSSIVI